MRSKRLTSAVTAAAAILALAPAGAAAAHNHRRAARDHAIGAGNCKLKLYVAPRLLTAGEAALAYGQGTCGGVPVAEQTVTVYGDPAGTPGGYSAIGTATTNSEGLYQLPTGALSSNTGFYATMGTARSPERHVRVAAQVTVTGPSETKPLILTGRRNAVTFKGTVSPTDAGATAVLQRENSLRGNEWHPISRRVLVDSSGNFSITHAFVVPGPSSIRVLIRSNHRNIASPSNVLSYAISQAQNPSLTIESSTDPLAFGSSTVIGGTVAGEPNSTVTLLGRAAGGKFAPVASTTTDGSGHYAFAPQAPSVSTFYRVQGSGRTSSVQYEGVKYILTAKPSASAVSSGQPISVTGTVTPVKAGHAIYLEKQNAGNGNFHVVAVGTVQADGSYSLSRTFFAPGSYTLRVKIPGDSENGGTPSDTFTVAVAALPSARVPIEPPVNGGLPPEGQS